MRHRAIWAMETYDKETGGYAPGIDRSPCTVLGYGPVQGTRKIRLDTAHPAYPNRRTLIVSIDDLWEHTPDGWTHLL